MRIADKKDPFPTEAGKWEYLENPLLAEEFPERFKWKKAKIIVSTGEEDHRVPEGILLFYPNGVTEPEWWPQKNCMWRKIV